MTSHASGLEETADYTQGFGSFMFIRPSHWFKEVYGPTAADWNFDGRSESPPGPPPLRVVPGPNQIDFTKLPYLIRRLFYDWLVERLRSSASRKEFILGESLFQPNVTVSRHPEPHEAEKRAIFHLIRQVSQLSTTITKELGAVVWGGASLIVDRPLAFLDFAAQRWATLPYIKKLHVSWNYEDWPFKSIDISDKPLAQMLGLLASGRGGLELDELSVDINIDPCYVMDSFGVLTQYAPYFVRLPVAKFRLRCPSWFDPRAHRDFRCTRAAGPTFKALPRCHTARAAGITEEYMFSLLMPDMARENHDKSENSEMSVYLRNRAAMLSPEEGHR